MSSLKSEHVNRMTIGRMLMNRKRNQGKLLRHNEKLSSPVFNKLVIKIATWSAKTRKKMNLSRKM